MFSPSVTSVDRDHIVQRKVEIGTGQDRIGWCLWLGYLHTEAEPDHSILGLQKFPKSILEPVISNGLHVTLSQHLLSFVLTLFLKIHYQHFYSRPYMT